MCILVPSCKVDHLILAAVADFLCETPDTVFYNIAVQYLDFTVSYSIFTEHSLQQLVVYSHAPPEAGLAPSILLHCVLEDQGLSKELYSRKGQDTFVFLYIVHPGLGTRHAFYALCPGNSFLGSKSSQSANLTTDLPLVLGFAEFL